MKCTGLRMHLTSRWVLKVSIQILKIATTLERTHAQQDAHAQKVNALRAKRQTVRSVIRLWVSDANSYKQLRFLNDTLKHLAFSIFTIFRQWGGEGKCARHGDGGRVVSGKCYFLSTLGSVKCVNYRREDIKRTPTGDAFRD